MNKDNFEFDKTEEFDVDKKEFMDIPKTSLDDIKPDTKEELIENSEQKIIPESNKDFIQASEFDEVNEVGMKSDNDSDMVGTESAISPIFPEEEPVKKEVPVIEDSPVPNSNDNLYKETVKDEAKKQKRHKFRQTLAYVCAGSLIFGSTFGLFIGIGSTATKNYLNKKNKEKFSFETNAGVSNVIDGQEINKDYDTLSNTGLSSVVKQVKPSVVCITTTATTQSFFGLQESVGAGSGIIFEDDLDKVYIVTNAHVITGVSKVGVAVGETEPVPAKLVGKEQASDIAVISVNKSDLEKVGISEVSIAKFGDSSEMEVGDIVLAIGNALGEGNTSTFGMLSAQDKNINVDGLKLNVLQTDAAINPGNSGGPLINLKGEVIGINTAKLSQSKIEGMGYSISSNVAIPIIENIMNKEESVYLGIESRQDIDSGTAERFNLPAMGVYVENVIENSPAEKAGIQKTDIITSFNNKPALKFQDLKDAISECKVGQVVEVKLYRNGSEPVTVKVKLEAMAMDEF